MIKVWDVDSGACLFTGKSIPADYNFPNFKSKNYGKEGHVVDYGITMSAEGDMRAKLLRNASNKERAYCVENSTVHIYCLIKK